MYGVSSVSAMLRPCNVSPYFTIPYFIFLIICDHSAYSGIFENLCKGLAASCHHVDMAFQVSFENYMVIIGHSL